MRRCVRSTSHPKTPGAPAVKEMALLAMAAHLPERSRCSRGGQGDERRYIRPGSHVAITGNAIRIASRRISVTTNGITP